MGSISAPDIFRDTLDEYSRSAELNNQAQQLRQAKAVEQQNIAASQQQMQQSAQLQPGVVQQQQLALKQQQYEADQRDKTIAASQAAYDPSTQTWDPDKFSREAGKNGVHPQQIASVSQALTKAAEDKATLSKDQLANQQAELGQKFQHIESLRGLLDKDAPNNMIQGEGVNNAYQQIMMDEARKNGQQAIQSWPTQVRTKDQIDQLESHLGMEKYVNDLAEQKAKTQHELIGTPEQAEMNSYLAANPGKTPWDFNVANKKLVPAYNFNLQNQGAAADQNGNPSAIAQAIAENRMKWSEAVSPRTPQATKNAIMAQVYKLNPSYDTAEFGLESDAAKKARSGAWADTRVAYNTAIDHADALSKAADALKNGDVDALNGLKNYFATQFGEPEPNTAQAIANAYNHEVTSVVAKGHMTDAEVAAGHGTLDVNKASPEQIAGVVQAYKSLMSSKRDELDKVIKASSGNKANTVLGVQSNSSTGHTIKIGNDRYQYKGTGDTADLANYMKL